VQGRGPAWVSRALVRRILLVVEGRSFWTASSAINNLQRFSSVVNDQLQPWLYFLPVMVVGQPALHPPAWSGPGQGPEGRSAARTTRERVAASAGRFSLIAQLRRLLLLAGLVFFTLAATKIAQLTWLPATAGCRPV